MVVKNIAAIDDEVLEKLEEVLEKENSKKPKGKRSPSVCFQKN